MRSSVGRSIEDAFEQFLKRQSGVNPVPTDIARAAGDPTFAESTPWSTQTPVSAATETERPSPTAVSAEYLEGVEKQVNDSAFNLHCQFLKRNPETGDIIEQIIVKTPSLRLHLPKELGRKAYIYFLALKSCTFARPPEPGLDWPGNLGIELPTAETVVVPEQDEQGRRLHGAVPLGDGELDLWKMRAERWPGGPPTTPGIELDVSGETPSGAYALVGGELIPYQDGMDLPMGTPILTLDGKLRGVYDQLLHLTTWLGPQTGERLATVVNQAHQGDPPEKSP